MLFKRFLFAITFILIVVVISAIGYLYFINQQLVFAQTISSDLYPPYESAPALTSYVSGGVFAHTYYISPTGNDTTGTGVIGNPWLSFTGATTGGAGTAVSAGDLIYMRGGTYPIGNNLSGSREYDDESNYSLKKSGTAGNYIVVTAYPGETQTFVGQDFGHMSFSIHGSYIVLDGLDFGTGGTFAFQGKSSAHVEYLVVQNFSTGVCGDAAGDQIHGYCIDLSSYANHIIIRNNYFGPSSDSHAIKSYTSNSIVTDVLIEYNRFYGITTSYGVIANKGAINNWTIAYNRFEDCLQGYIFGTTYSAGTGQPYHINIYVHHNVFDNVNDVILDRLGASTGDLRNVEFHDNVIYNATSGVRTGLMLRCDDGSNNCMNAGVQAIGEFWNNLFYGLVDVINPQTTSNFVNYPSYWNYNAYPSTAQRDTAENQNNLVSSSWNGSSVIAANHGITRTGVAGNRFYYISDTSLFKDAGRYGDTIGGFTFSGVSDTTSPSAPTGLIVQ